MRLPRALTRAVARAKPIIPDRAWPLLLTLRSAVGDGPLVGDPALNRVVVLAAHPDDESLGCAGTVALLRRAGADVTVAYATDGEATRGADMTAPDIAKHRRTEATAACAALEVDDVRFWGLRDGGLSSSLDQLRVLINALLSSIKPDGLFLPWFLDGHPDHEALGAALARAEVTNDIEVWGYETWTPLPANRIVDVTKVLEQKRAAIASHPTAALAFDLEAGMGLNRWRSIHGLMGRGYAEAFLAAPALEWLELRRKVLA